MTPEEKRREYYAQPSSVRKELAEMRAFLGFIEAAEIGIDLDSPANEKPPRPDISCTIDGDPYFFELGEVTDQSLARDVSMSARDGEDGDGGFFDEDEPLLRIIRKKTLSTYQTGGAPLDLVLHYDKQSPISPAECLRRHETDIAAALIPTGPFSRIWIYDSWTHLVLWSRAGSVPPPAGSH